MVNGYILAGGKSSRMNRDKGLLLLNDKAIVKYVIKKLQAEVDNVYIVSNNPEYKKFGLEVIEDLVKGIGPAGGIYSGLSHSTSEKNFMVSCDMPFITSAAIKFMISSANESDITLPMHDQQLEPLFGVYSKACLKKWKSLIDAGTIKLQELVNNFKLLKINVSNLENFNDSIFMNINTQNDFEKAEAFVKQTQQD